MGIFTFDTAIVIFYLLITLIVGIYKGRGVKNFREFAIGDYKFSDSTLIATITASWIGASSIIGAHEEIYQYGVVWMFIFMCGVTEMVILRFMASGILRFHNTISIAEILGRWYGPKARIIGGIWISLCSIATIGAQVAALGFLCQEFFHLNPNVGIIIGTGIVVLYSSYGGIKSVTYTDVLQFGFFMVALPLIASTMLSRVGGMGEVFMKIPGEHLSFLPSYGTKTQYLLLCLFFMIPICDPCLIQRVLMAKDRKQVINSFKSTAFVMFVFYILCAIIALSALAINPNLEPTNVLYHVINNYLPIGIKGLGIAGVLAVIMSTTDSYLNVSAVSMIHDVINPLCSKKLTPKQELIIIKITTIVIGLGAIFMAMDAKSITTMMIDRWEVWAPIIVIPFYVVIMGIRSNFVTFAISGIVGGTTVILWSKLNLKEATMVGATLPALATNIIAFALCHLYYNKYNPQMLNNVEETAIEV